MDKRVVSVTKEEDIWRPPFQRSMKTLSSAVFSVGWTLPDQGVINSRHYKCQEGDLCKFVRVCVVVLL